MKVKQKLMVSALILLPMLGFAQGQLKFRLDEAAKYLKEIKSDKATVTQTLSYNTTKPYEVKVLVSTTDSKGKRSDVTSEFNLALAGEIKRSASTKEMKVELSGQKGLRIFRITKDSEQQNYDKELTLLTTNADEARDLEKALKEAAEEAKKLWEKSLNLPKDDLASLQTWFENNVKEVKSDKLTVQQQAKKSTGYKDRVRLSQSENDGKKTVNSAMDFSWGDLNESDAELKISGKEVVVNLKAKNDYIQQFDGEKPSGFDNKVKIYANDPSEGSILLMVVKKIIPLASTELKSRLPKAASKEDGFKVFKDKTKSFSVNESSYQISADAACNATYTVKTESKGKSVEEQYKFAFGDLGDFKMSVSKGVVRLSSKVKDNNKFIQVSKDGQWQNYENSIEFITGDIESGRSLNEVLPAIVKGCRTAEPAPAGFAWLAGELKKMENPSQQMELQGGSDKCKYKLSLSQAESKKTIETVLEFNLYDLDPAKVSIDVSGKTIGISALTLNKEKFINQTKDGKSTFVNEVNFKVSDVETAKKALVTFKSLVEGCKK